MQHSFNNPMDLSDLPKPIAAYFAADKAKDTAMLELCFAKNALVRDENHEYRGLDAIQTWQREAQSKYLYVTEPLQASVVDRTVQLRVRLTGSFPGSPLEVDYTFTLDADKITALEIQ